MTNSLIKVLQKMNSSYLFKLCRIADSKGDINKVWYVEYYIWDETNEKLVRKRVVLAQATSEERYKEGKRICKIIDAELHKGTVLNKKQDNSSNYVSEKTTLLDAAYLFLDFQKKTLKKKSSGSYQTDIRRLDFFLKYKKIEHISLGAFSSSHVIEFLDFLILQKQISNRSRNNVKGTLSILFNFFINREVIKNNPVKNIKNLPQPSQTHTAYSQEQLREIKQICLKQDPQLWLYIAFIYYAFLRPGQELRLLKIKDLKEKTIFIGAENAKNNKSEHVIIPTPLNQLIVEFNLRTYPVDYYVFGKDNVPGDKPMALNRMYNRFQKILKKVSFETKKHDIYAFKHSGVIALFNATQNIEIVRQQCRHSSIADTQKYLRDLGHFTDYDLVNYFPEI